MKGTDVTQEQFAAAEQFIMVLRANKNLVPPALEQSVSMPWENLVRLVALFGAIRARAVANGNSPDIPGEVYHATAPAIPPAPYDKGQA